MSQYGTLRDRRDIDMSLQIHRGDLDGKLIEQANAKLGRVMNVTWHSHAEDGSSRMTCEELRDKSKIRNDTMSSSVEIRDMRHIEVSRRLYGNGCSDGLGNHS